MTAVSKTREYKRQKAREYRRDPEIRARQAETVRRYRARRTPDEKKRVKEYVRQYRRANKAYFQDYEKAYRKRNPAIRMVRAAKARATKSGLEFDLKPSHLEPLPTRCPVLGIELDYNRSMWGPDSPSIDRIVNTKGYTLDNIIVVSYRANMLKRDATIEELKRIADFYEELGN